MRRGYGREKYKHIVQHSSVWIIYMLPEPRTESIVKRQCVFSDSFIELNVCVMCECVKRRDSPSYIESTEQAQIYIPGDPIEMTHGIRSSRTWFVIINSARSE